jgi:hypothetical protein
MAKKPWTRKQGQYLAFIYNYTVTHGEPPAVADFQRYFGTSRAAVHQMIGRLARKDLVARDPDDPRSIRVLVSPEDLPRLEDPEGQAALSPGPPIYQLKITLMYIDPPIWRRVHVLAHASLARLHRTIQIAMGWWDYHLHEFVIGEDHYGVPHPEYPFEMKDERHAWLSQVAEPGARFFYLYDFGDGWRHLIEVEQALKREPGQRYPVCLDGRRAAPPEDVGGPPGYEDYLEALADPEHPEHERYLQWRGESDPEAFDVDEVNAELRDLW